METATRHPKGIMTAEIRNITLRHYADEGGITAHAELLVCSTIQTVESAGIWGVDFDSESAYLQELGEGQRSDLNAILAQLGFTASQIDTAPRDLEAS